MNFHATVEQLKIVLGSETSVADYLSKCLYSVNIGVNDYANNYFIPEYYSTSRQYTPEQFATVLIQQYSEQLKVSEEINKIKETPQFLIYTLES